MPEASTRHRALASCGVPRQCDASGADQLNTSRTRRRRAVEPRALFIDFDGVLHPTTDSTGANQTVCKTTLFGWLPVLDALLKPHSDVVLVVHSTWRYTHNVDELRGVLGSLGSRVVGATPEGPRYEAILGWLQVNQAHVNYRIVDDDAREFPSPPPVELILCEPSTGIAAPGVLLELRKWLES